MNSKILLSLILIFSLPSIAFAFQQKSGWALGGQLGYSRLIAGDSEQGVTHFETDTIESDDSNAFIQNIGLGYLMAFAREGDYKWFSYFKPSIDYYHFQSTVKGDVLMWDDPRFNNYTEHTKVENNRMIFNFTLGVVEWRCLSLFLLGGIGPSWTEVTYEQRQRHNIPQGALKLDAHTNYKWVPQGGVGIAYAFNQQLSLSLMYLYTDFGHVKASHDVDTTNAVDELFIKPSRFELQTQSALLGLQWVF